MALLVRSKLLQMKSVICHGVFLWVFAMGSVASAESALLFHWGDEFTTRVILEKGQYPDNAYDQNKDLSRGGSATYTAEVYNQLNQWNKAGSDAAGSGLYASKSIFDSIIYGGTLPNLLIVETSDIKLLTQYNGNWHIANKPSADIMIRPPNANDVNRAWAELLKSPNSIFRNINSINNVVLGMYKAEKPWPRSTSIFLERLVFDYAPEFILSRSAEMTAGYNETFNDALVSTMKILLSRAPGHKSVKTLLPLFLAYSQKNSNHVLAEMFSSQPEAMANLWKLNGTAMNSTIYPVIIKELQRSESSPQKFLLLYHAGEKFLSEQQKAEAKNALRERLKAPSYTDYSPALLQDIEALLGRDVRQTYEGIYKAAAVRAFFGDNRLFKAVPPSKLGDVQKANNDSVRHLVKTFDMATLEAAVSTIVSFKNYMMSNTWSEIYFEIKIKTLHDNLSATQKAQAEGWLKALESSFEDQLTASAKSTSSHDAKIFQDFVETAVTVNNSPEFLKEIFPYLVKRYPALQDAFKQRVSWLRLDARFQNQPFQIAVPETLELMSAADGMRELFASNRSYLNAPENKPWQKEARATHWKNLYTNIGNSLEYSRISKTFLLVDPLFVSEDLRANNANKPWLRFNESYHMNGKVYEQPAWNNFILAWEKDSRAILLGQKSAVYGIGLELLSGFVDGQGNTVRGSDLDVSVRNHLEWEVPRADWDSFVTASQATELNKFFQVEMDSVRVKMKFRPQAESFGQLKLAEIPTSSNSAVSEFVFGFTRAMNKIENPFERAVEILYLFPKLHPFNNGNGRLTRLWASAVLMGAGYPVPVGLPTNDFFMSKDRLRLELRKSLALGQLWQRMLVEAKNENLKPEDVFQKKYRGSNLEGLVLYTPASEAELAQWVRQLESITIAPAWGAKFAKEAERMIAQMRAAKGSVAQVNELEQFKALSRLSSLPEYKMTGAAATLSCKALFGP